MFSYLDFDPTPSFCFVTHCNCRVQLLGFLKLINCSASCPLDWITCEISVKRNMVDGAFFYVDTAFCASDLKYMLTNYAFFVWPLN